MFFLLNCLPPAASTPINAELTSQLITVILPMMGPTARCDVQVCCRYLNFDKNHDFLIALGIGMQEIQRDRRETERGKRDGYTYFSFYKKFCSIVYILLQYIYILHICVCVFILAGIRSYIDSLIVKSVNVP